MTRQLRKRIFVIMYFLLSLTFISILLAINIWIHAGNRSDANRSLQFILEQSKAPAKPDDSQSTAPQSEEVKPPTPPDTTLREMAASHYILVKYNKNNTLISIENLLSDSYTDDQIESYCAEILTNGKQQGTIGHLRYQIDRNMEGTVIAFIDQSVQELSGRSLLFISVLLGFIGILLFGILSYILSGMMVRPVEEAFEKQKQFISDASHELKTPIAVILSNSELLADSIGTNRQLSYIQQECDRMHHLVTSLLSLTRLEHPEQADAQCRYTISDAMLEQILPLESVAFEKGIHMEYDITPGLEHIGVKEQLQQVAVILIDNAFEHTASGGTVQILLHPDGHQLVFSVSNTGNPIPEAERAKLFERFYRTDKARSRQNGHFGLGLSIAQSIIQNHKGHITVTCANGITTFTVFLKACRPSS